MEFTAANRYTRLNTGRTMAILDIRNLSAGYDGGFVISGIDLEVGSGEFVAVLGRNGSGKSTLIRAALGLLPNVRGQVLLGSRDVGRLPRRQIAGLVAYVPQFIEPVFEFTVRDIVRMGRYARQSRLGAPAGGDDEAIDEALSLVGLSGLSSKRLGHLSGGEKQRVFIARALAQDTPLLLLDEPSLHLDISYQVEIYGLLKRLQREKGKAVLAAEHNINLAALHADRLVLIKDGEMAEAGTPAEMLTAETVRRIFGADVDIRENPHTGLPEISLITRSSPE
jgi:ABC-type cobalamin/Fe3+-siderophores transport system ATPase subunit